MIGCAPEDVRLGCRWEPVIGGAGLGELQIPLLADVGGVGALAELVDQCPTRTEFGESGEGKRREEG